MRLCCLSNTRCSIALVSSLSLVDKYLEQPFGAAEALIAILKDNARLVDTPDDLSMVENTIALVKKHRRSCVSFVRLLVHMCVCKGVGLSAAQACVANELVEPELTPEKLKSTRTIDDDTEELIFFRAWLSPSGSIRINAAY